MKYPRTRDAFMLCVVPLWLAGCASTGGTAPPVGGGDAQAIPRITALYEKATVRPAAHRFRRPLRDQQDRARRELAAECERYLARLSDEPDAVAALTGSTAESAPPTSADLPGALRRLAEAARRNDAAAMGSAHAAAIRAYQSVGP